jgi:integrase
MKPDVSKYEHLNVFQDPRNKQWRVQYRPPKALQLLGAKKVLLNGEPNTPEFDAAYERARDWAANRPKVQAPEPEVTVSHGSMAWLIDSLYASKIWQELAPETQKRRRIELERLRLRCGQYPAVSMPADKVKTILAGISNPHMRMAMRAALRLLMRKYAVETIMLREDDPTVGIKIKRPKSDGFATWTDEQIDQYRAFHPNGLLSRLVFELALELAARRSDICLLGPQHVRNGRLEYRQQKTGAHVSIEMSPELQAAISAYKLPNGQLTFTATSFGKTRSYKSLSGTFAEWRAEAGLPKGCVLHGLRKAHCRIMAEAGCTEKEIMSHSGHKTMAEVERYTKAAEQKLLADRASEKMREAMGQRSARVVGFPKRKGRRV